MVTTSLQGKSDGEEDDDPDCVDVGPDVDENAVIEQKTSFEKKYILKHRSLFSKTLSPNRYLRALAMSINKKNFPDKNNDPSLSMFKPLAILLNIKPQSRAMISQLELYGVIKHMRPNE